MTETDSERGYILVVEDDPDLRAVESEVLRMEGYDVRAAADGLEALETMDEAGTPRLILLDLRMPRMNGWDLAAALRGDHRRRSVPIIVVAAHFAVAQEAAAVGASAWLHKPVSIDDLLSAVERVYHATTDEVAS